LSSRTCLPLAIGWWYNWTEAGGEIGLDNFAARRPDEHLTPKDLAAFEEADIHLCGGILSGPPDSFRGKVYSELVQDVTGESLYQEWIPPERARKIYESLANCDPKEVMRTGDYDERFIDESAIIDLRKFFKVCVERELGLKGWW
jgi:hypothetical protein